MDKPKAIFAVMMIWIGLAGQAGYGMYDAKQGRWLSLDPVEYTDGMNGYEYVGSQPVLAVDPAGLWKVYGKPWESKPYKGLVQAECRDTWSGLWKLLPGEMGQFYSQVRNIVQKVPGLEIKDEVPEGTIYNLEYYFRYYENLLRSNVVAGAYGFHGSFNSLGVQKRYGASDVMIKRYFGNPNNRLQADCWDAAYFIMANAVIGTLKPAEYNVTFKGEALPFIEYDRNFDSMVIGNWIRFTNGPYINNWNGPYGPTVITGISKYPQSLGSARHENAIKVGENSYFGFPSKKILSAEELQHSLIDNWNYYVPFEKVVGSQTIGSAYSSNTHIWIEFNDFLDWAQIAEKVFHARSKK